MIAELLQNKTVNTDVIHGDIGIGKGTVAKRAAAELTRQGIPTEHSSSGDALRAVLDYDNSPYPIKAEMRDVVGDDIQYMLRKEMLPTPTVVRMFLLDFGFRVNTMGAKRVLLDGWIRDKEQNGTFEMIFNALRRNGNTIIRSDIDLDAPEKVKISRLLGRNEGRIDDGSVKDKLDRYHRFKKSTDPLRSDIRELIAMGILDSTHYDVNADQSPDKVFGDVMAIFLNGGDPHGPEHYHRKGGLMVPDERHVIVPGR